MVFTYPCTKYRTIADIHGTRTGDELFLHTLRHLAIARPDYYVQVFCPIKSETWLPQRGPMPGALLRLVSAGGDRCKEGGQHCPHVPQQVQALGQEVW